MLACRGSDSFKKESVNLRSATLPNTSNSKFKDKYENLRHRFPDLNKDLRKKYQEKIQRDRDRILTQLRKISSICDIQTSVAAILKDELKEFQNQFTDRVAKCKTKRDDFSLEAELMYEEKFMRDLLIEQEEWIMNEYEQLLASEQEDLSQDIHNTGTNVVCPVCKSGYFQWKSPLQVEITCTNCDITFSSDQSMLDIRQSISRHLEEHNLHCQHNPLFTAIPDSTLLHNLCIVCDKCSCMNVIL